MTYNESDRCPVCGSMPPITTRRGTYPKSGGAGQRHYCKKCQKFFSSPMKGKKNV